MSLASESTKAKKYEYTLTNQYLTEEQREFYEINGYLIIRNLVDHDLLDECKERFSDICNGTVDKGPIQIVKDESLRSKGVTGEDVVNKIQYFKNDKVLMKYVTYKPILDVVESIIGPNITTFHAMIINKPPNSEINFSRHPLHQDLYYMPFRPANSIVASWTAMQKVDAKNGCMFVIAGSHKWKLFEHNYPQDVTTMGYHGVFGFDKIPTVNLEMEKGDTVFLHPILIHGSGPNLTQGFRKSISSHYLSNDCHIIDVKGTVQEKIGEEIIYMSKKRGLDLNFQSTCQFNSVLVRGEPGKFQCECHM